MNQYVLAFQESRKNLIEFLLIPEKFWTFSYERQSDACFRNQVKMKLGIDPMYCKVVKGFHEPFGDFGSLSLVKISLDCISKELGSFEKVPFAELIKKVSPPRLRLVFVKAFQILSEENPEGVSVYEVPRKPE